MSDLREQDIEKLAEYRLSYILINWRDNLDNTTTTPQELAMRLIHILKSEFGYITKASLPELPLLSEEEKLTVSLVSKYPYKYIKDVIEEAIGHERDLCQRTLQEYLQRGE